MFVVRGVDDHRLGEERGVCEKISSMRHAQSTKPLTYVGKGTANLHFFAWTATISPRVVSPFQPTVWAPFLKNFNLTVSSSTRKKNAGNGISTQPKKKTMKTKKTSKFATCQVQPTKPTSAHSQQSAAA